MRSKERSLSQQSISADVSPVNIWKQNVHLWEIPGKWTIRTICSMNPLRTERPIIRRLKSGRRRWSVLLAGAAALPSMLVFTGAAPVSATALKPISYQLGWVTNTEFAGTYLAQTRGFFKEGGLNVQILPGGSDPVEPVVASGKALVGDSNADTVAAAVAAGAPLKIIGARYQLNPFCIISSAKTPIKNPKELIGKTVGVNTYNLTAWNVFLALNHLTSTQVKTVDEGYSLGPTPLVNGQVNAWMGFSTNEPGVLKLDGFKNYFFLMSSFGYHVYADVYVTTDSALKHNRAQLIAFMKAEKAGWEYDLAHPSVGTALTVKRYQSAQGFSDKQQALENTAQKALIKTPYTDAHGIFAMSRTDIAENIATLKFAQSQGIAKYATSKSLFDTSIIDAIGG
jgi:ABC-type nitrate/sulfonate/bicarbonate transport system substrate-binding protein